MGFRLLILIGIALVCGCSSSTPPQIMPQPNAARGGSSSKTEHAHAREKRPAGFPGYDGVTYSFKNTSNAPVYVAGSLAFGTNNDFYGTTQFTANSSCLGGYSLSCGTVFDVTVGSTPTVTVLHRFAFNRWILP